MTATQKIVINPVTRISGFMEISATIENNTVTDARTGGLLFRGFEKMLEGRSPFDAVYFTERICGICSTAHAVASASALEDALDLYVSEQGRYLRDFIHGCEFLQNHIRHFYQYTAPDFVRLPAGNTLFDADHSDFRLPERENDAVARHYFESFEFSRGAHEMLALLGGKAPHSHGVFVGGIAAQATPEIIARLRALLEKIAAFIRCCMIPDALTIAAYYPEYYKLGRGCGNFLSYGCFDRYRALGTLYVGPLIYTGGQKWPLEPRKITENIHTAWYEAKSETYTPYEAVADPDREKNGAYSWVKAPRYEGQPFEVGPLARMWLSGEYRGGISAMDRTVARVLEAKKITDILRVLLTELIPCVMLQKEYSAPEFALGVGMTDTTRGALGHWLRIENSRIALYQIITPSAWNLSTRCRDNLPGPCEAALIGTRLCDADRPVELGRIIRSFDPCVSCATHVFTQGRPGKTILVMP